jgi:hypothetical protein
MGKREVSSFALFYSFLFVNCPHRGMKFDSSGMYALTLLLMVDAPDL